MKYFQIIIIIWCSVTSIIVNVVIVGEPTEKHNDIHVTGHILQGSSAIPGQFKYQISIRKYVSNRHICGGSIITKTHILSAAHCFYKNGNDPTPYFGVVGTVSLKKVGPIFDFEKLIIHEDYDNAIKKNDIAILKVVGRISFNQFVAPIKIFAGNIPPGTNVTVSGWGMTDPEMKKVPVNLQYVHLKTISFKVCKEEIEIVAEHFHICTLGMNNQGFCRGDSGGSLVYRNYLIGIVSFSIGCGTFKPDVYINVKQHIEWIKSTTHALGCRKDQNENCPAFCE